VIKVDKMEIIWIGALMAIGMHLSPIIIASVLFVGSIVIGFILMILDVILRRKR